MKLVIDKVLKINKKSLDDDVSYLFECINFLNSCVVNLDSFTLYCDTSLNMRTSMSKVVDSYSSFNPNYNEDAANDMKDVDEDDGWGDADE